MFKHLKKHYGAYLDIILIIMIGLSICLTLFGSEAEGATNPGTPADTYSIAEAEKVDAFNALVKEFSLTVTGDQWRQFDKLLDLVEEIDRMRIEEVYTDGMADGFVFMQKYLGVTGDALERAIMKYPLTTKEL